VQNLALAPLSRYPLARLGEAWSHAMFHLRAATHPRGACDSARLVQPTAVSTRGGVRGQGLAAGRVPTLPRRIPVGKAFQ
jgi:hypothetical protein